MIRYYVVGKTGFQETPSLETCSWINLSPPFLQGELDDFATTLGIGSDFLTDPLDIEERARYEKYEEARSIIFNTPVINETEKENEPIFITVPIGIILCQGKIITICSVESPVIEKFVDNKVKNFNPSNETQFILLLFEQTVRLFLEYLKKLNIRRNLIEQELYHSSRSEELQSLLRIEKSLVYFVNSLSANELLKLKMKRTDFLNIRENEEYQELFEDIIVDNNQAREVAQLYTNILNGTMEAYVSIISNNLNKFINRLTLITVVLMVPTLISSFFGMNVPLPFSLEKSGVSFYLILILSLSIGLMLLWLFKRKNII